MKRTAIVLEEQCERLKTLRNGDLLTVARFMATSKGLVNISGGEKNIYFFLPCQEREETIDAALVFAR